MDDATWWAEVTFDTAPESLTDDQADALMSTHGVASARSNGARLIVEIVLCADRLATAVAGAVAVAENAHKAAFGEPGHSVGVRVLASADRDHEVEHPFVPSLVGVNDIGDMLGVSRQRAAKLTQTEGFPAPIDYIGQTAVYLRAQVLEWESGWSRQTGRPRADR